MLILGGGMAGVVAAHTLHLAGITDLILIEATGRIGGRVCEVDFGGELVLHNIFVIFKITAIYVNLFPILFVKNCKIKLKILLYCTVL